MAQPVLPELPVGTRVQDPFIVLDVDARGGDSPHTIITLGNATGRMQTAPFWPSDSHKVAGVARGAVVQVIGTVGSYRDRRQLAVDSLRVLPREQVDWHALMPSAGDVSRYWKAVDRWRADIQGPAPRSNDRALLRRSGIPGAIRTVPRQCERPPRRTWRPAQAHLRGRPHRPGHQQALPLRGCRLGARRSAAARYRQAGELHLGRALRGHRPRLRHRPRRPGRVHARPAGPGRIAHALPRRGAAHPPASRPCSPRQAGIRSPRPAHDPRGRDHSLRRQRECQDGKHGRMRSRIRRTSRVRPRSAPAPSGNSTSDAPGGARAIGAGGPTAPDGSEYGDRSRLARSTNCQAQLGREREAACRAGCRNAKRPPGTKPGGRFSH